MNKTAWNNEYYLASNLNYLLTKKRLLMMTKQCSRSKLLLKKNGKIIIEIGENQKYTAMKLLQINGFYINNVCRDYQSYPRVLVATKSF